VEWNRGPLGEFSNFPVNDARTQIELTDVCVLIKDNPATYDVIALDVDNGPEGYSSESNNWLYSPEGIGYARERLNDGGALAYWSATPDPHFAKKLRTCGLKVSVKYVYAHGNKGTKHTIWLART
jgi:spermidine synthase